MRVLIVKRKMVCHPEKQYIFGHRKITTGTLITSDKWTKSTQMKMFIGKNVCIYCEIPKWQKKEKYSKNVDPHLMVTPHPQFLKTMRLPISPVCSKIIYARGHNLDSEFQQRNKNEHSLRENISIFIFNNRNTIHLWIN